MSGPQGNKGLAVSPKAGATGPAGPPGSPGAPGVNGVDSFTATTAPGVQPAVSGTVTLAVGNSTWAVIGQVLFLFTGGYYLVTALPTPTSITLQNLGYTGNVAPTGAISGKLGPAGLRGAAPVSIGAYVNPYTQPAVADPCDWEASSGSIAPMLPWDFGARFTTPPAFVDGYMKFSFSGGTNVWAGAYNPVQLPQTAGEYCVTGSFFPQSIAGDYNRAGLVLYQDAANAAASFFAGSRVMGSNPSGVGYASSAIWTAYNGVETAALDTHFMQPSFFKFRASIAPITLITTVGLDLVAADGVSELNIDTRVLAVPPKHAGFGINSNVSLTVYARMEFLRVDRSSGSSAFGARTLGRSSGIFAP